MFSDFYHQRRVFLTGHTGFKGAWLALWLQELGAAVHGFSLPPAAGPSLFELTSLRPLTSDRRGDVRDLAAVSDAVAQVRPEIIFHLAAQSLVRQSCADPLGTLTTNVLGTAHLLEAVRLAGRPCTVIVVTTDKCYENRGWEWAYRENDPLGGHDVYSASKAAAELVVSAWRRSFAPSDVALRRVATVRAGNVIGGGDYAVDRILPDAVRALAEGRPIPVRNPAATRPWQHVLDCLSGYLWLGARLAAAEPETDLADAFNFGPGPGANRPVRDLVECFLRSWPGRWENLQTGPAPHEAAQLNLAIDRAAARLAWRPTWTFEQSVGATADWYHGRHVRRLSDTDLLELARSQIGGFSRAAGDAGLAWAAGRK